MKKKLLPLLVCIRRGIFGDRLLLVNSREMEVGRDLAEAVNRNLYSATKFALNTAGKIIAVGENLHTFTVQIKIIKRQTFSSVGQKHVVVLEELS